MTTKSNMDLDYAVIGMSLAEIEEVIVSTFAGALSDKKLPQAIMIWGAPGVGKTFTVYDAVEKIKELTGVETVEIYDQLTSTLEPSDVAGVPFAKEVGDGYRIVENVPPDWAWYISEEYEKVKQKKDKDFKAPPAIIMFDDIAAAHFQTQNAFYKGVHQGMWGTFHQRKNVLLVAAGNRQQDNTGANDMPRALASRFIHCYANPTVEGWLKWGTGKGNIHPLVIGYIRRCNEDLLEFNVEVANREEKPYACPRTWDMVSRLLWQDRLKPNQSGLFDKLVMGSIGRGVATKFLGYLQNTTAVVPPEVIVKNPDTAPIPGVRALDALYATESSLEYYIKQNPNHWKAGLLYATRKEMLDEVGVLLAYSVMGVINTFPEKQRQAAMLDFDLFDKVYTRYADIIQTVENND